jgi:hypothetical protein
MGKWSSCLRYRGRAEGSGEGGTTTDDVNDELTGAVVCRRVRVLILSEPVVVTEVSADRVDKHLVSFLVPVDFSGD